MQSELATVNMAEGVAYGAALLAATGTGAFASVDEACSATISVTSTLAPQLEQIAVYDTVYPLYRELYPTLKAHFASL